MKITELQAGQGNVDLDLEVVSIDEPREFEKFGKQLRVANAIVKDDSDQIKMSFWNEDIDKIKPGIKLKLTKGYCSEFQGEKQITSGKFGSFEILESTSENPTEDTISTENTTEEQGQEQMQTAPSTEKETSEDEFI